MLGSGLNLVTTVIGFGMSTTFIVFVCARLLCGRIRSTDSRGTPFDLELHSDADQSEHTINGPEPVLAAAIPTMEYKKYKTETFSSREDAQCSICLAEYEEKEVLRIMPNCNHNFHLVCIDIWLQKQITCPICRLPLNKSVESKHAASSPEDQMEFNHETSDRAESYREIDESESVVIGVPDATEQLEHIRGGS